MALYNFHRVLIAVAILFCFGFGLWSFRLGTPSDIAIAAVAGALSLAMVAYLIYFNNAIRVITRQKAGSRV